MATSPIPYDEVKRFISLSQLDYAFGFFYVNKFMPGSIQQDLLDTNGEGENVNNYSEKYLYRQFS